MNTSKQIVREATDNASVPIRFWGNIVIAVLGIVANVILLWNTFQLPEATLSYLAMVFYVLAILAGLAVIILTFRGHQESGAQLAFYTTLVLFASGPFFYTGRALTGSFSLITISAITISQLLPKELRRRSIVITGVALMVMWVTEWINPSWRFPPSTSSGVNLLTSLLFALILAVIIVRQAWGGNIRVKLVTSFTVIALISVGAVGTVMYVSYRNQVREDIRQRLLNIISITALQQDGDLFATIQTVEDMQGDAYQKLQAVNHAILATDRDLAYIFSLRVDDQGKMDFVVDSGLDAGYEPLEAGVTYDDPSELLAANALNLDRPIVEEDFYTDQYGTFLSAYAPIYKSDGTRAGIVGVDIFAGKVLAEERAVLLRILGTTLGTMLVVTLIGLWLGSKFVGPVINLSRTTQKIIEGDLNTRAKVETADEVGDLARAFNQMTSQLQESLQGLEQRIAERTRHLVLATEVGRAVSQVRDLDVLLKDASELILKEFNLYYVQVYLTAANQKSLNLEAGTGDVGAQLAIRAHSLPLDVNSINGRAALEKHSVVISDTTQSATFRQNPLLPETRGEMAIPLIVADKVVGVLDMQSKQPGELNEEVLPAFEALAGQLAVAIQNASLLKEANEARTEVEKQARRLVRQNWDEHLDAVHTPEQIGFKFDQKEVIPFVGSNESNVSVNVISSAISVTGEPVGSLTVQMHDFSRKDQTLELVNAVAQRMAQQIENLRLLESAERYRQKAELASRRLTHEGWQEYLETNAAKASGYIYDLNEVRPYRQDEARQMEESTLSLPLKVRDEAVGKLVVKGVTDDEDAVGLVNTIAEHLSQHIEGLRLSMQTEQALASTKKQAQREQALSQITSAVRGSTDPATILRTAARELGTLLGRKTIVHMATAAEAKNGQADHPSGAAGQAVANNGNESVSSADRS